METRTKTSTKMAILDPWIEIEGATGTTTNARRIEEVGSTAWGMYWGLDAQRQCLLILQCNTRDYRSHRFPQLKGLRVESLATEDGVGERVAIRLIDSEQRDLFLRFCLDIVETTRNARTPDVAVELFLRRTWRWHRLLKSGQDSRLTDAEQKGLIGELRAIERYVLPEIGAWNAVSSWKGPMGAPRDFQIGVIGIEAKAHTPQLSKVSISSLQQLDLASSARLFLCVTEVAEASDESVDALTVTDMAARVRKEIAGNDIAATEPFEDRLLASGFDWEDDYTDKQWQLGDDTLYEVVESFPRITPSIVHPAVEDARYTVNLSLCEDHRVPTAVLRRAISGDADGS